MITASFLDLFLTQANNLLSGLDILEQTADSILSRPILVPVGIDTQSSSCSWAAAPFMILVLQLLELLAEQVLQQICVHRRLH